MAIEEPVNYKQAAQDSNWRLAMKQEMESIKGNNTWQLTDLPPG